MSHPPKKNRGALAVGAYVPAVARAAFESHGFPSIAVLSDWPEIIGEEHAAFTAPERLIWPRNADRDPTDSKAYGTTHRRGGATLVIRVDGPRALEVQHMAHQLMERVNVYFGYRAVAEIRLVQGPVHRNTAPSTEPSHKEERPAKLDVEIEDHDLRAALERLGSRTRG